MAELKRCDWGFCCHCGGPAIGEVYSTELRTWRWWCRKCLLGARVVEP